MVRMGPRPFIASVVGVLAVLSAPASAEPLVLKCPWPNGDAQAQADLLTIDTEAKMFLRQVIDAADNVVWSSERMPLQVTEDLYVGRDSRGNVITLNRYTGAMSAATGEIRSVRQCDKYQKGQRRY